MMAQNCARRNICQTSRCLSRRIFFSPVICKSTISSATCPVPHSQDDGDRISDDSKIWSENKYTSVDPEKIPEFQENTPFSNTKGPSFQINHRKMRSLSPMKRLASILPPEYISSMDESENDKSHDNDNKSNSYCDAESPKTDSDSKDSQVLIVSARSKSLLPSQRLSKMIPSAYWEEVDKDTKGIIQNVVGDVFDEEGKKKKKNVPESRGMLMRIV